MLVTPQVEQAFSRQKQKTAITYRRAFPCIYKVSLPYKDELFSDLPDMPFSFTWMTLLFITYELSLLCL